MQQVFKESEFYSNPTPEIPVSELFGGMEEIRSDFVAVGSALKSFPLRSALTVVGCLSVVYIGFKLTKSFVKIKAELVDKLWSR